MSDRHRPRSSRSVLPIRGRLLAAALIAVWLSASPGRAGEGNSSFADALRQPGIRAEYVLIDVPGRSPKSNPRTIVRQEFAPTILLGPHQSPDSRIPASGWQVRWSGVIEVLQPGRYRFSARSSGPLTLRIDRRAVIGYLPRPSGRQQPPAEPDAPPRIATIDGQPIELDFGLHPFQVEFTPQGTAAELKLFWESEHFAREALTSRNVGHPQPAEQVEARAGVPIPPEALLANDPYLAGRLAVEEHSCVACHRPTDAAPISHELGTRPGPRLTGAGQRLKIAWIYHWLDDPQRIRPEAVMPRMFAATRAGEIERYAVATWLASAKAADEPRQEDQADVKDHAAADAQQVADGKALFERVGCVVCHRQADNRPTQATLSGLDQKTTAASLARYLLDPSAVDPAGRMPNMALSQGESRALASYLTDAQTAPMPPLAMPAPPSDDEVLQAWRAIGRGDEVPQATTGAPIEQRLSELGRQVMHKRRCTACHEMGLPSEQEFWQARPAKTNFADLAARVAREPNATGCLAVTASPADQPVYASTLGRPAVLAFLTAAAAAPKSSAPAEGTRLALVRFNCLACHERDGIGGLAPEFAQALSTSQTQEEAELIRPPTLTGIADKLQQSALEGVLTGDARARPWMSIRMPHFDREHVATLAAGLTTLDGAALHRQSAAPELNSELAEAGRQLVGTQGFGCTKCHDLLDRKSGGTRGPDLARTPERIQYAWFSNWMTDPQRLEPGTRMPTVFLQGESPYPNILDGDPRRQREAIWQYLLACRDLPLPQGFEVSSAGFASADQRVLVARTFLPNVSPRSMAIRSPSGLHLALDAQSCRLAYAWRGEFLDMTPVWTDRGGRPAHPRGAIRWSSPPGFPWDVAIPKAEGLPDFAARAADPDWGAPLPDDAQLHPSRVRFRGYRLEAGGTTFLYELELPDGRLASFRERVETAADDVSGRIRRGFEVATAVTAEVTLHVADLARAPQSAMPGESIRQIGEAGDSAPVYLPIDAALSTAGEGGTAVYRAQSPAAGARWCIAPRDGRWSVLLRFSTSPPEESARQEDRTDSAARAQLTLEVLLPTADAPEAASRLIDELQKAGAP